MAWIKHKMSNTRIYRVWDGMVGRCHRPSHGSYHSYGAKGISVCEEWRNSFEVFYEWAIANGYDENAPFAQCTLDRIDGNGNYCHENCRWVSMKEQSNNLSTNHRIEYKGENHTISEWSEILGISKNVLYHRFERGWTVDKALGTPKRKYG